MHKPGKIGLRGLIFALIGSTIGSGWLFAGLYAAQIAGPAAVIAWLLGGSVVFLFSLVYMELGIAFPISGGMVKYTQLSHGPLTGYVAGITGWLCYVMVAPLEVLAILQYAINYLPVLGSAEGSRAVLSPVGYATAVGSCSS
jgi:Gamma-aminobutyrate permease and related permeases